MHSVRINGKVRNRLIKYLGAITEDQAEIIRAWLKLDPTVNPNVLVADLNKTEVLECAE